jgi:hypothetical protein
MRFGNLHRRHLFSTIKKEIEVLRAETFRFYKKGRFFEVSGEKRHLL